MLKGIPAILSPELLKIMMEMPWDEIVLGDGNFPAASCAKSGAGWTATGFPRYWTQCSPSFADSYWRPRCPDGRLARGTKPAHLGYNHEIVSARGGGDEA